MNLGSLFSGAGLGDLGWLMAGFKIQWQVEIDEYCQKILNLRFPESDKYYDIKTFDPKQARVVDILVGGVPCQAASVAGKQRGSEDDRWQWPEALRVLKEVKPRWVVWENVFGLLSLEQGMEFENICTEMESYGYEIQTFSFTAHSLGASHRRERIWIVGYSEHNGRFTSKERGSSKTRNGSCEEGQEQNGESQRPSKLSENVVNTELCGCIHGQSKEQPTEGRINAQCEFEPSSKDVADTGQQHGERNAEGMEAGKAERSDSVIYFKSSGKGQPSSNSNTEGLEGSKNSGNIGKGRANENEQFAGCNSIRNYWSVEPGICRVVDGCPSRVDRLKALGNGQVMACTAFIGQQIMEFG